ncbi:hypothetical protein C2G38_1619330 [Gigaspora rosea]|uniref:Uncharacterized protein n=1 Tax=Gigaspora rosea TaxID=44941 RepID=A0A397VZX0_9GLOM|nr:hypothetical protein C2G38_1619330 [Gigaspora rosea]
MGHPSGHLSGDPGGAFFWTDPFPPGWHIVHPSGDPGEDFLDGSIHYRCRYKVVYKLVQPTQKVFIHICILYVSFWGKVLYIYVYYTLFIFFFAYVTFFMVLTLRFYATPYVALCTAY